MNLLESAHDGSPPNSAKFAHVFGTNEPSIEDIEDSEV
jgi:hypothetical protein